MGRTSYELRATSYELRATTQVVVPNPQEYDMTNAKMQAEIARLQAANAALQAANVARSKISFKVSEKGALSVYGLQRFPVTLYREQWTRIFDHKPQFDAFIAANDKTLTRKAV